MIGRPSTFGAVQVLVSEHATEEKPRFPDKKWTKRRRRRVIGKYGSWTIRKPAAFRMGARVIVHPIIYARLQQDHRVNSAVL